MSCRGTNFGEIVIPDILKPPASRALTIAPVEPRILDMRLALVPAILAVLLLAGIAPVAAQTLGDVAKKEAERRKAVATPGKVYTNDNLRKEPPPSTSSPAQPAAAPAEPAAQTPPASPDAQTTSGQTPGTAKPAEAAPTTEEGWRQRITGARDAVTRSQMFAEALQSRINGLNTDFVNRDDPVQRNTIAAERQKALVELDRVKQEIADQQKAITTIQDEARRAGVPPGWVR